jgi:YidC/Oxa1 family membrane protein insertase
MDVVKTGLMVCIGVVLYYLLLQWPSSSPVVEQGDDILINEIIDQNDSEDLLSPLEKEEQITIDPQTKISINAEKNNLLVVENDILSVGIDGPTGRFISSTLKRIKNSKNGETSFSLFGPTGTNFYFANSGFFTKTQGYLKPNFTKSNSFSGDAGSTIYELEGAASGLLFKRIITLYPEKYFVNVEDIITGSLGEVGVEITPYVVIERSSEETEEGGLAYTYLGPVFSTELERFEKYSFDDIDDLNFKEQSKGGWVSLIQHYFLTAWVPDQNTPNLYQARKSSSTERYSVGYTASSEVLSINNASVSMKNTLYVGPKLPEQLKTVHPDLDLVVDYGFLWWLGKPIYWLLNVGHDVFKNWGVAIIFLTLLLKIVTWPFSAAAYKSMGKMRLLQPKIAALQAQHGDDKQKLGQATMEFYKKEGVNPLGGCLPMLVQMPFFLAFYWVLMETVELRHSPFVFWIDDLSAMDPFFVLPLLNAAGMYYSQKLTPTPANADPMQAQLMKYFPLIFACIFAFFPSGLVLYWLVNMLVTLLQQWWYYRKIAKP